MLVVAYPEPQWVGRVGPIQGVEATVWDPDDEPPRDDLTVVVAPYTTRSIAGLAKIADLPSVRLVQLLTAGYETVLGIVPEDVSVANAAGVHDASTAELAVGLVLALLRGIPDAIRGADRGRWSAGEIGARRSLADRRVLVVGYGSVGRAVASRLVSFEVERVSAVALAARDGDDIVETVHGVSELARLLPDHDVAVVTVPLTERTHHLVDERFLGAMPDDALVVNVARGPVADTEAILRHARRLWFGLDVTDPEPLPDGHPLFAEPRVLVSPHVGGNTTAFTPRAVRLLRAQLSGMASGEPPRHLVRRGTR